jgi:hypothetical protein
MRVRDTYRSYRDAVAQGNQFVADRLLPVLRSNKEAAVQCAVEEMGRATTVGDREIAQLTYETLRR